MVLSWWRRLWPAWVLTVVALLPVACSDRRETSPTPIPTPVPQPVPVATTVLVTGHVLDSATNEPVVGASVVLRRPDGLSVSELSDGAGHFAFSNVPTGVVTVWAAKVTHDAAERQVTLTGDLVVDLVLTPRKYSLYGRVSDVISGLPLAGATITVLDGPSAARSTTSGSDGTYRLSDLWFGGFTLRIRRSGYDSVFRGINFTSETELDIQMRVERQSLSGTWTGELTSSTRVPLSIPEVTMTHMGATIAADFPGGAFTGTLADPAIGTTTQVTGTLTVRRTVIGPRLPPPPLCVGTGRFTGTVTWTRFLITAPQVIFSCGGTESMTLSLVRQQ